MNPGSDSTLPEVASPRSKCRGECYTIGDMGYEFVNGKLMFFIVKEIKWNAVTHDPEYVKVPALGVKS
jgi:hypothetical protein